MNVQVNARHPDAIKMTQHILNIFSCGAFWGIVKVARVHMPCTKVQPPFMDAPGNDSAATLLV